MVGIKLKLNEISEAHRLSRSKAQHSKDGTFEAARSHAI
jgi:hypothetical protein